jgi:hypothetical protein
MKAICLLVIAACLSACLTLVATPKNSLLVANYHRYAIGSQLLDLETGRYVDCDTDIDCQEKTGISY